MINFAHRFNKADATIYSHGFFSTDLYKGILTSKLNTLSH